MHTISVIGAELVSGRCSGFEVLPSTVAWASLSLVSSAASLAFLEQGVFFD